MRTVSSTHGMAAGSRLDFVADKSGVNGTKDAHPHHLTSAAGLYKLRNSWGLVLHRLLHRPKYVGQTFTISFPPLDR